MGARIRTLYGKLNEQIPVFEWFSSVSYKSLFPVLHLMESCENITVYDLKGVSRGQFNSDTFEMIKVGNKVMVRFHSIEFCVLVLSSCSLVHISNTIFI